MGAGTLTNAGAARIVGGGSLRAGITHVALYTADPGDAGSHTNEIAASNGYARQSITWTTTGNPTETNTNLITFNADGSWGNVTHWGLVTNGTRGGGQILMHGPLNSSRAMNSGNQIRFNIGAITLQGLTS